MSSLRSYDVAWTWRDSGHLAGFRTRQEAERFIDSHRADPEYSDWVMRPSKPHEEQDTEGEG